jgi:RES domain-containing protein
MQAWRISHRAFPAMDGGGAAAYPGRWNGPRQPAIYCGGSFAIAVLERLCYASLGRVPKTDVYVEIAVPDSMIERFDPAAHGGWDRPRSAVAKAFGVKWLAVARSVALLVPSVVTRLDWNLVINPSHPDFSRITWSAPKPVAWDRRLFAR